MDSFRFLALLCAVSAFFNLPGCSSSAAHSPDPPPAPAPAALQLGRGVNIGASFAEADLAAFAATGATLVRISFPDDPLRDMTLPYAIRQDRLQLLDRDLDLCEKYHLRAIIDPHRFPGMTGNPYTTYASDPLWSDPSYRQLAVELWSTLAVRYASRGSVIAGYDLLNEPNLPNMGAANSPADWNQWVALLIHAIRASDTSHTIIVEAPALWDASGSRMLTDANQAFASYLAAPPDANLVYSFHMYAPTQLTFQGAFGNPAPVAYPGVIAGKNWNRQAIVDYFAPVLAFQKQYSVPIYLGEFSAVRWAGDPVNSWISDVLQTTETYRWNWTYHDWRGSTYWDAEKSNSSQLDETRYPSTPRLEMLKAFWAKGSK